MGIRDTLTIGALILVVTPCPTASFAKAALSAESGATTDASLSQVFEEIARQRFGPALNHVDALIRANPNFRLAHLIKGDLLLARVHPLATMGNASNAPAGRIEDLREEAVARLQAYRHRPGADRMPS